MDEAQSRPTMNRALLVPRPGLFALVVVMLLAAAPAAFAQETEHRGTSEQQAACMPDVFRLCFSEIPSVSRIVACLKREKPQLSEGCRMVFEGSTPRTVASGRMHRRHAKAGHRWRERHAREAARD
jgi:hypothetical protein